MAHLEVPCEEEARFRVLGWGLVSLPFSLPTAACRESKREAMVVPLLAAGTVTARFVPPGGGELPPGGSWTVRDCASEGRTPAFAFQLPIAVGPDGASELLVPAGCLDLRARFTGFAPEAVFGIEVLPGGRHELGVRRLLPAAAVTLQVVDSAGRFPVRDVPVLLTSPERVDEVLREMLSGRHPRTNGKGVSGEDGRVEFEGLAPGAYAVVVVPRSAALAPAVQQVPVLGPGVRHDLGRVRERLGASITVMTEPSEKVGATEYITHFTPVTACTEGDGVVRMPWREEVVVPGGAVTVGRLPAGVWQVDLLALDGEERPEAAGRQSVDLAEGESRFLEFPAVHVEPGRTYHGRIEDDDEAGALDFAMRFTAEADDGEFSHGRTESEKDGSFTVRLRRPGSYLVNLSHPQSLEEIFVPNVRVDESDDEVIVRLPRGRIEGRVVDEAGDPVRQGYVQAVELACEAGKKCAPPLQPRIFPSTSLREDGTFALRRLPGGSYQLHAGLPGRAKTSTSKAVDLAEGGVLSEIVLVLRDTRTIELALASHDGRPLAGLGGILLALDAAREVVGESFTADATGRASIALRAGAHGRALVLLDAPGRAIAGFWVDTERAGPHPLALPPTGSLVVRPDSGDPVVIKGGWAAEMRFTGPLVLIGGGAVLPIGGYLRPPWIHLPDGGRVLRLDGLTAGEWTLVRGPENVLETVGRALRREPLGGVPLASFHLEPGDVVMIDLAVEAAADGR